MCYTLCVSNWWKEARTLFNMSCYAMICTDSVLLSCLLATVGLISVNARYFLSLLYFYSSYVSEACEQLSVVWELPWLNQYSILTHIRYDCWLRWPLRLGAGSNSILAISEQITHQFHRRMQSQMTYKQILYRVRESRDKGIYLNTEKSGFNETIFGNKREGGFLPPVESWWLNIMMMVMVMMMIR